MDTKEYHQFVKDTSQFDGEPDGEQFDIAIYGVAGEIGSVVAAIKKQLLQENGEAEWNTVNDEIKEELGDAIWYCFTLARIRNKGSYKNILKHDIEELIEEIDSDTPRAGDIGKALSPNKKEEFLKEAPLFCRNDESEFDDYQQIAFLTARTEKKVLLEVCLSVLWQLGAELLRAKLPDVELCINKNVKDRDPEKVLGEIIWHLSALAVLYGVKLSEIIETNIKKINYRRPISPPTELHDKKFDEKFPRKFEISFLTIAKGRSRMYLNGKRLGDDLTDNSYDDDGYRFHDVMHLANAAVLCWSPVLRRLLGLKRKSVAKVDEVEDGARASIVEEAIVKAIHSEGVRVARQTNPDMEPKPVRLFPTNNQITFKFLKFIREFVAGLEVDKNQAWEWEKAILQGYEIFHKLCLREQGTVIVDLNNRSLEFRPDVYADISGSVGGIGSSIIDTMNCSVQEKEKYADPNNYLTDEESNNLLSSENSDIDFKRVIVVKDAILSALGVSDPTIGHYKMLEIDKFYGAKVSTRAVGEIQDIMWDKNIICFRNTLSETATTISCVSLAITDPTD